MNVFEEVAKFRAERRLWARLMRERYGATNPKSWRFRTSVQTAGNTLTSQEPLNNIVRATNELIAAVLSGVQSVHLSAYDEGLSLPTERSQLMCLRTQQIIGHESGLTETVDPLAGSYFVERLTDEMEAEILRLMERVAEQGGMVEAVRSGWLEAEIAQARVDGMRAMESGEKVVVGVNAFRSQDTEPDISIHAIRAEEWGAARAAYLREYRAARDQAATDAALTCGSRADGGHGEHAPADHGRAARERRRWARSTARCARPTASRSRHDPRAAGQDGPGLPRHRGGRAGAGAARRRHGGDLPRAAQLGREDRRRGRAGGRRRDRPQLPERSAAAADAQAGGGACRRAA